MKTLIASMILLASIGSANAGNGIKIERPCGSKCEAPKPALQVQPSTFYATCCAIGTVRFRDHKNDGANFVAQSRMTIETNINGTTSASVIDSTYRSYR